MDMCTQSNQVDRVVEIKIESDKRFRAILPVIIVLILLSVFSYFSTKNLDDSNTRPPVAIDYGGYRCSGCNVILITIDSLRADHLGSYGYFRNTSPNIDRFADDGVLFTSAYAQASATSQSLSSLMTSKSPTRFPGSYRLGGHKLDEEKVTLAEMLRENGYITGGIVTNSWLKEGRGFDQGFDYYYFKFRGDTFQPPYISSDRVTKLGLNWLKWNKDQKFFLWLHYMEPHTPYISHEEYQYDPGYQGKFKDSFGAPATINKYKNPDLNLTDEELYHAQALYDGEINYVDNSIGALLSELKEMGLYNNTVIIITTDHGEEFKDHKSIGHGHTLYNELINVPLIIRVPGSAKIKTDRQVRLLDVVPTVLDILKIETNSSFDGVSLLPILKNEGSENYSLEVYSKMATHHSSIISGDGWKLILSYMELRFEPQKHRRWEKIETRRELYNLKDDPGEQNNLVDEYPEIAKELEERLTELQSIQGINDDESVSSDSEISNKTKEELKSLGYVV